MKRRARGLLAAALVAVAASAVVLLPSSAVAQVPNPVDCATNPLACGVEAGTPEPDVRPVAPRSGVSTLIFDDDTPVPSNPEGYERYGSGSYQLAHQLEGIANTGPRAVNAIAEMVFSLAMWLVGFAVAVLHAAFTFTVADRWVDTAASVVDVLGDTFVDDIAVACLALVGLVVVWRGARNRSSSAWQAAAWAVLAATVAFGYIAAPHRFVGGLMDASAAAGQAGVSVVGAATDRVEGEPDAVRGASLALWDVYVTRPWHLIQFGSPAAGERWGDDLLAINTFTDAEEREIEQGGSRARTRIVAAHQQAYEELLEDIEDEDPTAYEYLSGGSVEERVGAAAVMLLAGVVMAVLVIVVAVYMLTLLLALLLFTMLVPLVLAVAMQPTWGRRLATAMGGVGAWLIIQRLLIGVAVGAWALVSGVFVGDSSGVWDLVTAVALATASVFGLFFLGRALGKHVGTPTAAAQGAMNIPLVRQVAASWAGSEIAEKTWNATKRAPQAAWGGVRRRLGVEEFARGMPVDADAADSATVRRTLQEAAESVDHGRTLGARTNGSAGRPPSRRSRPLRPVDQPAALEPQTARQPVPLHALLGNPAAEPPPGQRTLTVVPAGVAQQPRQPAAAPAAVDQPWERPTSPDPDDRRRMFETPPPRVEAARPTPSPPAVDPAATPPPARDEPARQVPPRAKHETAGLEGIRRRMRGD